MKPGHVVFEVREWTDRQTCSSQYFARHEVKCRSHSQINTRLLSHLVGPILTKNVEDPF